MKSSWRVKGNVTLATLPGDFLMFNFNTEEDVNWVMENGPWWFGKSGLHLKKWYEGFNLEKETFMIMPMWISLLKLPLDFQFEEAIVGIASTMGDFICLDIKIKIGQAFQMARVCINIDITKLMKTKICLKNRNGEYLQEISFDIPPMICKGCSKYGHSEIECPRKTRPYYDQGNGFPKGQRRNVPNWKLMGSKIQSNRNSKQYEQDD